MTCSAAPTRGPAEGSGPGKPRSSARTLQALTPLLDLVFSPHRSQALKNHLRKVKIVIGDRGKVGFPGEVPIKPALITFFLFLFSLPCPPSELEPYLLVMAQVPFQLERH